LRTYGAAKVALAAAPEIATRVGRSALKVHSEADAEAQVKAKKRGARILASCEPDFPVVLKQIDLPPPVIAVPGDLAPFKKPAVAIVGSRNA